MLRVPDGGAGVAAPDHRLEPLQRVHAPEQALEPAAVDHRQQRDGEAHADHHVQRHPALVAHVGPAQRQQNRPQQPPGHRHRQKIAQAHVPKTEEVAQDVLGKAGNQKHQKRQKQTLVLHHVVVAPQRLGAHDGLDQRPPHPSRQQECRPGTEGKADRRQHHAPERPEHQPADETGRLARYRRGHDLQRLQADKNKSGIGHVTIDELEQPLAVEEQVEQPGRVQQQPEADHESCQQQQRREDFFVWPEHGESRSGRDNLAESVAGVKPAAAAICSAA